MNTKREALWMEKVRLMTRYEGLVRLAATSEARRTLERLERIEELLHRPIGV